MVDLSARVEWHRELAHILHRFRTPGIRRFKLDRTAAAVITASSRPEAEQRAQSLAQDIITAVPQAAVGITRADIEAATGRLLAEARRASLYASLNLGASPVEVLDHPVEEALIANPELRQRAAQMLDPLADQPEFVSTLYLYLAFDRDRSRVARSLAVHPRTVDYRLRRIASLTGLQPQAVAGGLQLVCALIARTIGAHGRHQPGLIPVPSPPLPPAASDHC